MADDAQGQDGISQYFTLEGYNAQVLRWPDVERRVGLGLSGAQVIERGPGYSPSYTGAGRLGEKRGQWQNGAGHATAPTLRGQLSLRSSCWPSRAQKGELPASEDSGSRTRELLYLARCLCMYC